MSKRDWWDKEFRTLLTLGESTTAGGWSSCRERCWAAQLAGLINEFQRVPVQFVNMGIGANVISTKSPKYETSGKPAADERLDAHVLDNAATGHPMAPDLLVVSYGLNDARGGTPIDLFCDCMKDIVRRVRERIQPLIVLMGPYYMSDFQLGGGDWSHADLDLFHQYNEAIRAVAEETDCLFVDLLESYRDADWLVHHDGCHANDLGHRIVANKVFEILASNCSGLARETQELEKDIPPWRDESTLRAPPEG
ncbi:MAG: SGNH/GDSL hydrolase family protein [Lentisphaeria bacterium]|jgi:lysophospholipase L1-like esterase|nr:SGNH/GDSL hydrolase family protein [Lentisphaeria bacterium]